jgi:hypothetical protein
VSNACPGQPLKKMPKITNATNTFPPPANPKPLIFFNFEFLDVGHFFFQLIWHAASVLVCRGASEGEARREQVTCGYCMCVLVLLLRQHTSEYVNTRQHTSYVSAYVIRVRIRHASAGDLWLLYVCPCTPSTSAYVSIRQHPPYVSAYVIRQQGDFWLLYICPRTTSTYVSAGWR